MLAFLTAPAFAFAGDGEPVQIPWGTMITLALVILTGVAGGIIGSMKRTIMAFKEALKIISDALEDDALDDTEIKAIVKASVNCHESAKDLIKRISDLFKKSAPVK